MQGQHMPLRKDVLSQLHHFVQFLKANVHIFMTDLRLLSDVWQRRSEVFWGILLTSFIINILSVVFPIVLLQVYDRVIPNQAINTLILLLIGVGIALLLETILKICRYYLSGWADAKFEFFTSCKAFQCLIHSPLQTFEKEGSGIHLKRINALHSLRDFYSGQAIIALIDIPFLLLFLLLIGYIGGWLVAVPCILLIYFILRLIPPLKKLQQILDKSHKRENLRINYLIETLGNIHTVKSMAMEAQMIRRYERLQKESAVFDYDLSVNNSKLSTLTKNFSQIMIVAIVALGSVKVMSGTLTV